jgi:hypothetical protein
VVVDTNGKFISPHIFETDIYHVWWDENLIRLPSGWMNHQGKWVWQPNRLP